MLSSQIFLSFKTPRLFIVPTFFVFILFYYLHICGITSPRAPYIQATPNGIPKKIWYKLGPKGLNSDTRNWTDSCISINPRYQVVFLTDEDADEYVKKSWEARPDIVETYLGLSIPIVKADLLRYLLLFDQGGIWSDLDISCEGLPIDQWIPQQYNSTGLVVGWEFDMGWGTSFIRQFASWTIMAKPKSPHLMQLIEDIMTAFRKIREEQNVPVKDITITMTGEIVDFSGPRRLTNSIIKSLGQTLDRTIEMDEISQLLQPKSIGDVLILPGHQFSASANTYTPEEFEKLPPKLVSHHYAGSWKNIQGGEV
ncbi:unnamed protein product [Periconia digitata]|uniref:Glycosyltransferase family 32 protein n=1 Tax=Periconia digitata TaxID=1303443 RepID=A0A9W4UD92_9PLEO|nr:unnamed protein product [Periconia digitata]